MFRHRALIRQAIAAGHEAHDAELVAAELEQAGEGTTWRIYVVTRSLGQIQQTDPRGDAWHVPGFIVEAALRWQDDRDRIAELEAGSPPAQGGVVSPSEGLPGGGATRSIPLEAP